MTNTFGMMKFATSGKEQTMSEDLIKRSDAIRAIDEWIQCGTDRDDDIVISEFLSFLKGDINAIPSADRPQGEWIIEIDANGNTYGRCSICSMRQYAGQLNFCPDCGAKMKGIDDEISCR